MASKPIDIVEQVLDAGKPAKPVFRTARAEGKRMRIRVIDANSPSFAADFLAGFQANVRRAREENRALNSAAE